ncbi:MAG: glycosyl hydrolase 38 domain protein [Herbinix sp.]|jgi:alpha-mannosidase|nr:glycosyl hydrolase 38 domain protein [Herbinix sp.]
MAEKLYFVDGYHGGIEGHMPVGSWEDILDAMDRHQEWKLSLEIEPESWEYLRIHNNEVYQRLQHFVSDEKTADRVELISGSYAQPFCWAINGESNIRQLIRGVELIHKHFGDVVVDTYAVQEPCFTSALPQICKKLGYKRMSLKNPTAWGGYMGPMKGGMIRLTSADGSGLPAVPRYDCEELVSCSATEAAGYEYSLIQNFADKCVKNGIKHPVGMCLQDLGWSAHPLLGGFPVEYVTWREYFNRFGEDLEGEVRFSQESILCTLPWGNITLSQMCGKVRALENRTLQIEKLLAMAEIEGFEIAAARDKLKNSWDMLMLSQHHDGFICATTPGSPLKTWAFRADYLTTQGQKLLTEIEDAIYDKMRDCAGVDQRGTLVRYIRVYNTVGTKRTDLAEVMISLPSGCFALEVYDCDGNRCEAQWKIERKHADESIAAAKLYFVATMEGIGYNTYCVKLINKPSDPMNCIAKVSNQNTITVETSMLTVIFDLARGGAVISLCDKELGKEFVSGEEPIGILKGFLVDQDRFVSNLDCVVEHEMLINGPICSVIKFKGEFEGIRFETIAEVREGDKKIDFTSRTMFDQETKIGYPNAPKDGEEFYGTKRSSCREDYKLGVHISLPMEDFVITKHAPFENYTSEIYDTRFEGWDEIKNTILHQYIDFYDPEDNCGLGILCDRITGYSLVDHQFSITQAFGYHAGFWWGNQPLKGTSQLTYSLVTHRGDYEEGNLPLYNSRKNEPFLTQLLTKKPDVMGKSVLCFPDPLFEVVAMLNDDGRYKVRVFNHSKAQKDVNYYQCIPGFEGNKADLQGKMIEDDKSLANTSEIMTLI